MPTLTATDTVATGEIATIEVRVTTRSREVTNSGGAVSEKEPRLLALAVAICVKAPVNGNSCFSSATGSETAPETEPVTVMPEPQIGRIVEGVMATPVGALEVVKVRLPERAMPAALVATVRKLYRVLGFRPARAAVTATAAPPAPIACSGVAEP